MNWLQGPLSGVDTESTGVRVEKDRIVTACVGFAEKPGQWRSSDWLINPGVKIPQEAIDVHSVTNEQAAMFGVEPATALAEISDRLYSVWAIGAPVIGHNVIFDLTIIDREMRRHLGRPLEIAGSVIDTLVLDKAVDKFRRGSRKLVDVAAHYGVPLTNAHSADADCFAAVRIAWVMINDSKLAGMSLEQLHAFQVEQYAEQRTSFFDYLRRKGEHPDDTNTVWPLAPLPERKAA